ncbi:MAG: alpha/beta hydrolase fold domain-containing protein [Pseudomonadota bacterium]
MQTTRPRLSASLLAFASTITGTCVAAQSAGEQIAASAVIGKDVQAVGADSFATTTVPFPDGVRGLPDVTYQTLSGYRPLKLDLFLPPERFAAAAPRPWVMYIHGGGWVGGGPRRSAAYQDWPRVLASLAAKGYVVASVSYRFAGEAPFPAAIQDVKAAIRWLKANASKYHLEPNRGMTWGQSAGGHLAALAAVSCGDTTLAPAGEQSDCVSGAVAWFGVYDFKQMNQATADGRSAVPMQFLGCGTAGCTDEQLRRPSPVNYVDAKDPPIFLMHGDQDQTVALSQSQQFEAALKAAGVPTRLVVVPGVGHSWIGPTLERTQAASRQALVQSVDFIEATIGDKPAVR